MAITPPLPPGPFDLIYADPALFFRGWSRKGEGRSPQQHYRREPVKTVCQIPVESIAAPNSVLCDRGVSELVRAPRLKPSGTKPSEIRHYLERLYGDVRRVELFARGEEPLGWTFWGDQAGADRGRHRHLSTAEVRRVGVS